MNEQIKHNVSSDKKQLYSLFAVIHLLIFTMGEPHHQFFSYLQAITYLQAINFLLNQKAQPKANVHKENQNIKQENKKLIFLSASFKMQIEI